MTTSRTVRMGVRRAATLGILALLAGAPAEAGSTVASGVTNGLYTTQNPFDRNNQRKVVRDSTGACYVVFTQTTTDREVRIARSADCSTSWQQFLLFGSSTAGQEFKYPSIDISDDRKTLHVVAVATSPVGVLHSQNASLSGSGWSTADNWQQAGGVDPTPGTVDYDTIATAFAEAPSVAVDPEGARTWSTSTSTARAGRTSSTRTTGPAGASSRTSARSRPVDTSHRTSTPASTSPTATSTSCTRTTASRSTALHEPAATATCAMSTPPTSRASMRP